MRPWLYGVYFFHAVGFSVVISQAGFLPTLVAVALTVLGVILWRRKCPHDFAIRSYVPRVLVALTYALVFFVSFQFWRKTQPMNYRVNDLAALGVVCLLLAIYSATIGRRRKVA